MNNKHYTFIFLIFIILYIIYSIIGFKYKDYKKSSHIEYIKLLNKDIKINIDETTEKIEYKKSNAYINKILKQDQNFKNKEEKVVYLTTQEKFETYTNKKPVIEKVKEIISEEDSIIKSMTIYQKWIYFLFKKDIR